MKDFLSTNFRRSILSLSLFVVLSAIPKASYACDACGCSGNGGSMGYSNTAISNYIGLRYITQEYRSRDDIFNNSPWAEEHFNTVQLWSNIPIADRISVNVMLPYHSHQRKKPNGTNQKIRGVGDITLMGFYTIMRTKLREMEWIPSEFAHSWRLGLGVKAPIGKFDKENNEAGVNPSFQVGTGSWDYTFATDYQAIYKSWGANAQLNYTVKNKNSDKYNFGNQWNYGVEVFKRVEINSKSMLLPSIGIAGEVFEENKHYGLPVANTKGDVLFLKAAASIAYSKVELGATLMLPLSQNLNNAKVEVKHRVGVYLNYSL